MKSQKSSWACFVVCVVAIMVSFFMSSCGATPTPTYPAPTLVSPVDKATIIAGERTDFSWHWDGALQEKENFDLRIWRLEKTCCTVALTCDCNSPWDTPPDGLGSYLWQVAVVRIGEGGNKVTLSESLVRSFVWNDEPTPTPTPTDTPTNTPTLTPSPTSTSTPTSTPTPTITPTPTSTATPTPTDTPTPTPKPTLLPPPIPLEPENGANFLGEPVLLKWQWDRPLAPDEVFSVRVRREEETRLCHHDKADKPEYKASLSYCTAGTHYWSVALARDLRPWLPEDDINRWQNLSETSAERWFYYVPSREPWKWPELPREEEEPGEEPFNP